MRKRFGWVGVIGTVVFGAAGCGGSSSVPLDDVGDEFVSVVCDQARRCPDQWGEELALVNVFESSLSGVTCEDILARVAEYGRVPGEAEGVENGTIEYDAAQARRCVRALSQSCIPFQVSLGVGECQGVFTGLVPVGDPCETSSQCVPSAYCDTTDQCEGTCRERVALGEPCEGGDSCRPVEGAATHCGDVDGDSVCVQTTILTGAAVGQSCGQVDVDGTERSVQFCANDLYCRRSGDSITGSCAVPVAAGNSCTDDDICEQSYFCVNGTCRTVTFANTAGDPCNPEALIACDGSRGLACDEETESCVRIGGSTVGEPCEAEDDDLYYLLACDPGLFCDTDAAAPTCKERFANGQPCESDNQCVSGYCIEDECSAPVLCEESSNPFPI